MLPEEVLKGLGLSVGATKTYLALLKLGCVTVARLKEETGLHRTTVYDFLEQLINKGLCSYVIKSGVKYFQPAKPEKLYDMVKEKEEQVSVILPDLIKLSATIPQDIRVEVFRGKEGFKTVANDILTSLSKKKPPRIFCGLGVDEAVFKEKFPYAMESYFKKEKQFGIKERMLTYKGATFVYKHPTVVYRYLRPEFFSPTPILMYADKVAIGIWEPLTWLVIDNNSVANAWRIYFEILWNLADKAP
ncbi:MAG: helix-turn-helix domain-containing protein [Candidatus Woesearchaeota archaeon]|nr:helix-turn-helix domain-containing protein [Candidatus Woesearchaeota archaeon]